MKYNVEIGSNRGVPIMIQLLILLLYIAGRGSGGGRKKV